MERQLKRGALLAVIALLAMGCSARTMSGTAGGVGPPPRIVPAVLVPVDENGNLHGSVGPWAFFFDLDDENVRTPQAEVASTATEIATYMKEHPFIGLRIDPKGPPAGTDAYALGVRDRRIAAIRDALVNAGVSADRITLGVAPMPRPAASPGWPVRR